MSVEDVPAIVNIDCTQVQYWVGGGCGEECCTSVEKKKSVAGQFAVKYRSKKCSWTQKLNREDYGVDKYWYLLLL